MHTHVAIGVGETAVVCLVRRANDHLVVRDCCLLLAGGVRGLNALGLVTLTHDVTEHCGRIETQLEHKGKLIGDFDVATTAHALAMGAILVAANTNFAIRLPLIVIS